MEKQEERRFNDFIKKYLEKVWDEEGNPNGKQIKWLDPIILKNWITEHDKRMKDEVIEDVKRKLEPIEWMDGEPLKFEISLEDLELINKHKKQ